MLIPDFSSFNSFIIPDLVINLVFCALRIKTTDANRLNGEYERLIQGTLHITHLRLDIRFL